MTVSIALGSLISGCSSKEPEGREIAFSQLSGWEQENHAEAFRLFHQFCMFRAQKSTSPIADKKQDREIFAVCQQALRLSPSLSSKDARLFFENVFMPYEVVADPVTNQKEGLLTGYYEPEFEGSLQPDEHFRFPLYSNPPDYVSIKKDETLPGVPAGLTAARRLVDKTGAETFIPLPTRAHIEKGGLKDFIQPLVYLKEPGHSFIIHVQGSAKILLPNAVSLRVAFAGRNGYSYSSIGKVLVQQGEIPLSEMSLERLLGWLKNNPEKAQDVMNHNESFIFFRIAHELKDAEGPIGGAGMPLMPERSLAIDHTLWSYGLPIWLEGSLPAQNKQKQQPLARLMLALDTGAAIVGPARADFFWGSGEQAGTLAGTTRQKVRFVVFLPKNKEK